ncbi:phosphoribosylamine--glycine ligase [Salinimicrobium sediminis]|uniref:Phosphoribosylamine--glycine ligase n=1 Tax=Salinimicrobium sediminis TaxID=1343891 RepID=A0A285X249_9FLAO|nr:phosphoribosylamine--glycine ligase [Salinimicrobium sediminis]SOC79440.1 phosphoribosylamine--glycine ligase [Salinimicrobium sediminis]
MNILILGSGGREHTFAHQISQSSHCQKLFVAPGNAGTAKIATNVSLKITDFEAIKELVIKEQIDMMVVGPEDPLVEGIVDFFSRDEQLKQVAVIGPSKRGALLEGSKQRAKEFMGLYNIPTAAYESFKAESLAAGKEFLTTLKPPYVLKADGLAAGKGVLILNSLEEAQTELENMLTQNKFGNAGNTVVIEEFLDGIELSVFVLTDGKNYKILPTAKDYKRIGEGDVGLNTGGMGAISPVPFADESFMKKVEERIVKPTIGGLEAEKIDYKGFVFIGLIKVGEEPYVIEYNVRMGDPETEVVLPRIETDLVEVFQKTASGRLDEVELQVKKESAATLVLVSGGYPEDYEKGKEISGLENVENSIVFHAGTKEEQGKTLTNGGRVLAITSFGNDFREAIKKSYQNAEKLHFDKMYFRKDIGFDL